MTKEARIHKGEKTVYSINGAGKNGQLHVKKAKLQHLLIPYTKINSKWIKDLNVRPETIKLLEKSIGRTLFYINHSNIFLDLSPKGKEQSWRYNPPRPQTILQSYSNHNSIVLV